MKRRLFESGMVAVVVAVFVAWAPARLHAGQKAVPDLSGIWKLNVEASVNPNGPAPAQPAARSGGGGGGGGGDRGMDMSGGAAKPVDSQMDPAENKLLQTVLAGFRQAPPQMALKTSATEVLIGFDPDPAKHMQWKHTTDDKKQTVPTAWGGVEAKAKWNGATLHRELVMNPAGGLKFIEDYTLSADGKQLIMTLKASSIMTPSPKIQNVEIKRVYDRIQ